MVASQSEFRLKREEKDRANESGRARGFVNKLKGPTEGSVPLALAVCVPRDQGVARAVDIVNNGSLTGILYT